MEARGDERRWGPDEPEAGAAETLRAEARQSFLLLGSMVGVVAASATIGLLAAWWLG